MSCQCEHIGDCEKCCFSVCPWYLRDGMCRGQFLFHVILYHIPYILSPVETDQALLNSFPCLSLKLFFDFPKRESITSVATAEKDDELSKYCGTRIVYEWFLSFFPFLFFFLLMWAIKPLMRAFDVALHCLAELQEIEREDQGSEVEKRWRTGVTRSMTGFSRTLHTEMNKPCMTCWSVLSKWWRYTWQRSKNSCMKKHQIKEVVFLLLKRLQVIFSVASFQAHAGSYQYMLFI